MDSPSSRHDSPGQDGPPSRHASGVSPRLGYGSPRSGRPLSFFLGPGTRSRDTPRPDATWGSRSWSDGSTIRGSSRLAACRMTSSTSGFRARWRSWPKREADPRAGARLGLNGSRPARVLNRNGQAARQQTAVHSGQPVLAGCGKTVGRQFAAGAVDGPLLPSWYDPTRCLGPPGNAARSSPAHAWLLSPP